jgi:small subunit ribosomal protein S4
MNLAASRAAARQLVQHGFVHVNNRRVDIPAYTVKVGDEVSLKVKEPMLKRLLETAEILKDRKIPVWLEVDAAKTKAKITALPTKDDIGFPIQEQLIVELYSK